MCVWSCQCSLVFALFLLAARHRCSCHPLLFVDFVIAICYCYLLLLIVIVICSCSRIILFCVRAVVLVLCYCYVLCVLVGALVLRSSLFVLRPTFLFMLLLLLLFL